MEYCIWYDIYLYVSTKQENFGVSCNDHAQNIRFE